MFIELKEIVIRDFQRKDAENIRRIVREKDIFRFMKDWSENTENVQSLNNYIDWLQSKKDSVDIYENKRYAIALKNSDEMIGMVGMGLEDNINEVEVAYFMSERFHKKGYTKQAVDALTDWCFLVSDIPYLVLNIDCANEASAKFAEKCDFQLFEKRTPIGHVQPNMESDSYLYFRKYRKFR